MSPPFAETAASLDDLLYAASTIFGALGRGLICVSPGFRVVHASSALDDLVGEGAAAAILEKPVEHVLGPELFGPGGTLRQALEAGERREGWGATLRAGGRPPRRVSLAAAPIPHEPGDRYDPRLGYVLVVRPVEKCEPKEGESATGFSDLAAFAAPRPEPGLAATAGRDAERERLRAVLDSHQWRRDDAARALGMSRTTLWRRMRELDLLG